MADPIIPELLTTREAARLCGMGERTLWRHSRSGAAPAPRKIGVSLVRYSRQEILAWIAGGCLPIHRGGASAGPCDSRARGTE